MKDKYIDLIEQTFDFPQDEFTVEDNELNFHDIPLMELIKQYGTPLKITYLPKISSQIARAKENIELSLSAMATNSTDIVKVTMADGKTMLVNYTTGSVIVKVSDTRYELIAARSYIKID